MTYQEIKTAVCKSFGIKESDFTTTRANEFVYPRFAYYMLCKSVLGFGVMEISKTVSKKHSTIINGITRHNDLIVSNYRYSVCYNKAKNLIEIK
jgi:chromosomal replication initiation ATPase DnaA